MSRVISGLARFPRWLARAFLVVAGLATAVSFVPGIPVLGILGPLVLGPLGPWLPVLALVGTICMLACWRRNGGKSALVIAGLAALAVAGSCNILMRQAAVAREQGVKLDLKQVWMASSQSDESLHPITIAYTRYDGQPLPLDIYRPPGKPDGRTAPIFVYIHGGGWGSQTLKQRQSDYRWFVERGYLVVSIEYPLSSGRRHTWNVAEPQLGCALAWLGAHAAQYGGDTSRLALWGESAGGNLVLNLAYRASQGTLKPACPGAIPHVAAVAALYPVIDPALMYDNPDPLMGLAGRMMGDHYTGGSPRQVPDRYAAIASTTHINAKAPPTLLIIPESDHLVDPRAAYAFDAKARAAGIETRLIRMPFAEHSFDLRSGSIGSQLVRQAMLHFLEQHELRP